MADHRKGPDRFPVDEAAPTEAIAPSEERRSGVRKPDPAAGDTLLTEPKIGQPPPQAAGGTRFGRYDMHRMLAVGGMAEVFLAREVGTHGTRRHVAVKRILPQFAEDPTFVQMFLDEARLAMHLNHPSICHIYDFGDVDGAYFIAMEFVNGVPLGEIIQRCPAGVPVGFATRIIAQVAEALHHAHQARDDIGRPLNIVHRDVSPLNVMVRFDGVVKLLDFGIAKAATQSQRTQAGVVKGKFSYMSPEQCLGKPLDARSDIFALGACLHEALTARPLFKRHNELETMRAVIHDAVPSVCAARSDVPPAIDQVLQTAMAKEASDRFQTAGDMFMALEQLLSAQGELVRAMHIAGFLERLVPERVAAGNRLGSTPGTPAHGVGAVSSGPASGPPGSGQVPKAPRPSRPGPKPPSPDDFRDIPTRELSRRAAPAAIDDDLDDDELVTSRISPQELVAMLQAQRSGKPAAKPERGPIPPAAASAPEARPSRPKPPGRPPPQAAQPSQPAPPRAHPASFAPAPSPPAQAHRSQPSPSQPRAAAFTEPPRPGVAALRDAPLRSATKRRRIFLGAVVAVLLSGAGAGGMYWYRTDLNQRAAAAATFEARRAAMGAAQAEPMPTAPVEPDIAEAAAPAQQAGAGAEAAPAPEAAAATEAAPAEAPEPPATSSTTGTLVVETQPERAFVQTGRLRRRRGPATFPNLRPRTHVVRVSAPGYRSATERVQVVAGETAMIAIELQRARRRR